MRQSPVLFFRISNYEFWNMKEQKIHISQVLNEFDDKLNKDGTQRTFSIKFIKNNGELVFKKKCVFSGLSQNMSAHSFRGIIPINDDGVKISHPTPIYIWLITEFNGKKVVLR